MKKKHGLKLGNCLLHDRTVFTNPLEIPTALVAQTRKFIFDIDINGQGPSINSAVKVMNYPEVKSSLTDLLGQYRSVLAFPREPLGVTDGEVHHIRLDTKPICIPAYHLPRSQRNVVDNMVNNKLEQGVIQESLSPWNSPLFLVLKKGGTFRPIIDFHRVSAVTLNEHYLLPVLSDLLMSLGRVNIIFSSLDLLSGYWQVEFKPDSREITAFITPSGH